MPTILFLLLLTLVLTSSTQINQHRRILHQPFFPLDSSLPPTIQPPLVSPQQQPNKYPFSTTQSPPNQQNPFFPFYPSPPPPPPPPPSTSSLATFPANISSLILPQSSSSSSSKPISRKLVAVAVAVSLLSLSLIVFIAAFLVYHRRHRSCFIDKKKSHPRSDNLRLFPPNTATSDKPPPPQPSSSSEFLYPLGNSRSIIDEEEEEEDAHISRSNVVGGSSSSVVRGYQKLGSPELHPLPPLPRHNNFRRHNFKDDEEEEDEFFSPRGSSGGGRGSPIVEEAAESEHLGERGRSSNNSRSSNASSYPSSSSSSSSSSNSSGGSPVQSIVSMTSSRSSINPLHNNNYNNLTSPRTSLRSKSPDDSVFEIPPPSRPPPPIPTPIPTPTPTPTPTPSIMPQSPPSSAAAAAGWKTHYYSPGRISEHNHQSHHVSSGRLKLPPPPPPLLPPRFWETPVAVVVVPRPMRDSMTGPPVLVAPSRPVVLQQNPEQVSSSTMIGQQQKSSLYLDTMEKNEEEEETPKPKLKPLHWDKVRASSDRAMVWDQLKSSSFQLNEEMIETLFMVSGSNLTSKDRLVLPYPNQENRVLDPKKSQNIAILLRALNVTIDEVCEALLEGNADTLGTELLESLLKMAPTKEEERKLREFKDESPFKLGPAEKFLKAVLDVPFAFKRVDAMLYIANFDSEVEYLKRSFQTLEAACEELRNSRMFMKLLEAVLKTGNRMNIGTNRGDAQAFKLDTLLKLVDIKGTDGKTTLLHFVVQEIIRAEGFRLSGANMISEENHQSALRDDVEFRKLGLQVVSGLSGELTNVKKAAAMDSDILSSEVEKLARGITKIVDVLKLNEELALKDSNRKFFDSVNEFLKKAEEDLIKMQAQESVALSIVKEITEYFHGNSAKEEAHPFRIFMVVRDFLSVLDQVCKEVGKINERSIVSSTRQFPLPINPGVPPIFPGFNGKRHCSSTDDDDDDDDTSSSP